MNNIYYFFICKKTFDMHPYVNKTHSLERCVHLQNKFFIYDEQKLTCAISYFLACTYIDHGSYRKGSSSNLLYSTSGTLEFCKMECSTNPSCKGFGRMSGSCYFSSSSVPMSTTCSGCSFYTKDNCGSFELISLIF